MSSATTADQALATTTDTLLRGRVTIVQPVRGYRSSLDPVLLAGFVAPPFGRFLEIGCGCGVLSFLLLAADPEAHGTAVEIQPRLAKLAGEGRARNGFDERMRLVVGDVRNPKSVSDDGTFDLVVTNPPFRAAGRGPASPQQERAIANHELTLRLPEWVAVAARVLRPRGRLAVVFAAERMHELLGALEEGGLSCSRLRCVHPRPDRPATRVLVEASRRGPGRSALTVEAPLIVHEADGSYSSEARRMLGEST